MSLNSAPRLSVTKTSQFSRRITTVPSVTCHYMYVYHWYQGQPAACLQCCTVLWCYWCEKPGAELHNPETTCSTQWCFYLRTCEVAWRLPQQQAAPSLHLPPRTMNRRCNCCTEHWDHKRRQKYDKQHARLTQPHTGHSLHGYFMGGFRGANSYTLMSNEANGTKEPP